MGEAAAPVWRCTPILLLFCLFQDGYGGGTKIMYGVRLGKDSLSGSLSMSYIVHVESKFCLGRRGGKIGDGDSDWGFF